MRAIGDKSSWHRSNAFPTAAACRSLISLGDLCAPDFLSRSVRYQSISERTDRTALGQLNFATVSVINLSSASMTKLSAYAIVHQVDYRLTLGLGEVVFGASDLSNSFLIRLGIK